MLRLCTLEGLGYIPSTMCLPAIQELLDATHEILAELEREHKASKVPSSTGEPAKQDADADEMREKFRIVRVTFLF